MGKRKPRPICPSCGSVDMAVFKKHATCNRCHKACVRAAAFVHAHRPEGQGNKLTPDRWRDPIKLTPGSYKDNS